MLKSPITFFSAIAVLLAAATVTAQVYKWVDKDGKVQYTDQPPPASATKAEAKKMTDAPASGNAPAAATPAKSPADRAKASDKQKTDAAEKAKKDADAAKTAEINQKNCKAARTELIDLEAGRPIVRTDETGQRNYISDEQRKADIARAKEVETASCKS